MLKEIFGKKCGMTQIFDAEGNVYAATLLEVEPVYLLEKIEYPSKTKVRIGCLKLDQKRSQRLKRPILGYFKKIGVNPYRFIREVEIAQGTDFSFLATPQGKGQQPSPQKDVSKNAEPAKPAATAENTNAQANGQTTDETKKPVTGDQREVGVEIFKEGEKVDIRAKTKGKGFQGGVKRHGWSGQPASHGSMSHRRIGSVGSNTFPGRVFKGLRMPGHMGNAFRTAKNLKVLKVDRSKNILLVEGSIPGARGAFVRIRKTS